jgi:hypothetical protein
MCSDSGEGGRLKEKTFTSMLRHSDEKVIDFISNVLQRQMYM